MAKMNPDIKAQWVAALRSGKYQQGDSALKADNKFCCLGVLCELYAKTHSEARWDKNVDYEKETFVDATGRKSDNVLSDDVIEWAGLNLVKNPENPIINEPLSLGLANYNDGCRTNRKDFNGIADLIEEHL